MLIGATSRIQRAPAGVGSVIQAVAVADQADSSAVEARRCHTVRCRRSLLGAAPGDRAAAPVCSSTEAETAIASLVLTQAPDAGLVTLRPARMRDHFVARLCAWRLDRALAGGASPDAGAALSLRASRLIGARMRRALAAEIREVVADGSRQIHPLDRGIHVCVPQVAYSIPELVALAERLAGHGPVDAAGVARVRVLLRDGSGPLYNDLVAERLPASLRAASDAIDPRP